MEEMSLKNNEINSLKKIIENLESTSKLAQINAKTHEHKEIRLGEKIKGLQKELTFTEQIAFVKNHLWKNIIEAMHSQWPSIQVIYEQRDLLLAAQTEIQKTKD